MLDIIGLIAWRISHLLSSSEQVCSIPTASFSIILALDFVHLSGNLYCRIFENQHHFIHQKMIFQWLFLCWNYNPYSSLSFQDARSRSSLPSNSHFFLPPQPILSCTHAPSTRTLI